MPGSAPGKAALVRHRGTAWAAVPEALVVLEAVSGPGDSIVFVLGGKEVPSVNGENGVGPNIEYGKQVITLAKGLQALIF
jgi:hypothetical protein